MLLKNVKDFLSQYLNALKTTSSSAWSFETGERIFSSLRRLKTYLGNIVGSNGLALLMIHRDIQIGDEEDLQKLASSLGNLHFVL